MIKSFGLTNARQLKNKCMLLVAFEIWNGGLWLVKDRQTEEYSGISWDDTKRRAR